MGDCGAFGYIAEKVPPYTTDEILDYYTRLDFDFGVSIDHLIVTATEAEKRERYELTIHNAEEFLREHRKRGLDWTPIGAVQGWDAKSYASRRDSASKMGYGYIGSVVWCALAPRRSCRISVRVHEVVPAKALQDSPLRSRTPSARCLHSPAWGSGPSTAPRTCVVHGWAAVGRTTSCLVDSTLRFEFRRQARAFGQSEW